MDEEYYIKNKTPVNVDKKDTLDNSDVIKHTLFSLVSVAHPKTSKDYAWSMVKRLLKELEVYYGFLKYIKIDNIERLQNNIEDITVMSKFDTVEPKEVGTAIQSIVDVFKVRMGKKAGYFFISEFRDKLGDEYHTEIKKMGVDLRLIDLKKELHEIIDRGEYKIKDEYDSNIAFVKKE
jgi:hypothetical protein